MRLNVKSSEKTILRDLLMGRKMLPSFRERAMARVLLSYAREGAVMAKYIERAGHRSGGTPCPRRRGFDAEIAETLSNFRRRE